MPCRACGFDHSPTVRCEVAARLRSEAQDAVPLHSRNHAVTNLKAGEVTPVVTCNQCAEKDAEIARLREELARTVKRVDEWNKVAIEIDANHRKKAKRDRAAYMRDRRAKAKQAEAR